MCFPLLARMIVMWYLLTLHTSYLLYSAETSAIIPFLGGLVKPHIEGVAKEYRTVHLRIMVTTKDRSGYRV